MLEMQQWTIPKNIPALLVLTSRRETENKLEKYLNRHMLDHEKCKEENKPKKGPCGGWEGAVLDRVVLSGKGACRHRHGRVSELCGCLEEEPPRQSKWWDKGCAVRPGKAVETWWSWVKESLPSHWEDSAFPVSNPNALSALWVEERHALTCILTVIVALVLRILYAGGEGNCGETLREGVEEIQVDDMAQSSSRGVEKSSNSFQEESTGLLSFFQWLFVGVRERKPFRMTPDKIFGQHLEGKQLVWRSLEEE